MIVWREFFDLKERPFDFSITYALSFQPQELLGMDCGQGSEQALTEDKKCLTIEGAIPKYRHSVRLAESSWWEFVSTAPGQPRGPVSEPALNL